MIPDFTIGILRETQYEPDRRVALTPRGARSLLNENKRLNILVQPSKSRIFTIEEYMEVGCLIREDLSDCDLLLGVKEVDKNALMEDKIYMFFSHTAKKQQHNQQLLQTIIDKNITLIDYEYLYAAKKDRIAAFGYYAGIVGAYNTLRAYGLKKEMFSLAPLNLSTNKNKLWKELRKVVGGNDKILISGKGNVSRGVEEVMQACHIFKVDMDSFFNKTYNDPVYFVADPLQYVKHKKLTSFTFKDFKTHPKDFKSNFLRFAEVTNIYIAAHYWDIRSPRMFHLEDTKSKLFNIEVIGDITCDIDGSVPTTQRVASIDRPYYDYNPVSGDVEPAFSNKNNITIMAVNNLPSMLARESSEYFSAQLVNHVLSYFWMGDYNKVLKKATIAKNGKIKKRFAHLRSFVQEKL